MYKVEFVCGKNYLDTYVENSVRSKMLIHAVENMQPGTFTQNFNALKSIKFAKCKTACKNMTIVFLFRLL